MGSSDKFDKTLVVDFKNDQNIYFNWDKKWIVI